MQANQNKTVLHVDDDWEDREIIRETIARKNANIAIKEIDNGKEAISYLQQAKSTGDLPCLIVLDLNMPGMNGWQVFKEIKGDYQLASIPVVIFTTSSSELDKHSAKTRGIELITKPPTQKELSLAVDKLLQYCWLKIKF